MRQGNLVCSSTYVGMRIDCDIQFVTERLAVWCHWSHFMTHCMHQVMSYSQFHSPKLHTLRMHAQYNMYNALHYNVHMKMHAAVYQESLEHTCSAYFLQLKTNLSNIRAHFEWDKYVHADWVKEWFRGNIFDFLADWQKGMGIELAACGMQQQRLTSMTA